MLQDIAEGGSKGVCLVTPMEIAAVDVGRETLLHRCVKAMTDGLLDLLVPSPYVVTADGMRDGTSAGSVSEGEGGGAGGGESGELLYLGPDENITPNDINWVVQRAGVRGYAMPAAFMSSKPREGINHKEYGVTSEGVNCFLHEALKQIGIEPTKQPWTIKLTGGPDGDVRGPCTRVQLTCWRRRKAPRLPIPSNERQATHSLWGCACAAPCARSALAPCAPRSRCAAQVAGNMLRILHRDYGDSVRVVGMADGSGCAEDPDGLPMAELLRLVDASLPLAAMDRGTLSPRGSIALADTAEGAALRNTMASRVVADAFVPAGGRPASINASNWQAFMCDDGRTPSAKVVVEGANLYFTPDARARLFEACSLPIVKDSSANKCGVVCSSLEIVSSMVLSPDEFVAIKPQYVAEVLDRLRELATLEARMLFAERALDPTRPLPQISEEISVACLRVTTALAAHLARFDHTSSRHRLWPLVREQLPPSLFEAHAAKLPAQLPWQYQKAMIASGLVRTSRHRTRPHPHEARARGGCAAAGKAAAQRRQAPAAALASARPLDRSPCAHDTHAHRARPLRIHRAAPSVHTALRSCRRRG